VATGRIWLIERGYQAADVGTGANSTGATR